MDLLVGKTLKKNKSEDVSSDVLQNSKFIALYFSASYCAPCEKFTNLLTMFYKEMNSEKQAFEVVLMPFDKSEEAYVKYFAKMPWFSVPFADSKIKEATDKFGVTGIPKLLIFTNTGLLLTQEGRKDIATKGEAAWDEWKKAADILS